VRAVPAAASRGRGGARGRYRYGRRRLSRSRTGSTRVGYDRGDLDPQPYWSAVLNRPVDAALAGELDRLDITSWLHRNARHVRNVERLAAGGANLALLSNTPESLATAMDHAPWTPLFPRRFLQLPAFER